MLFPTLATSRFARRAKSARRRTLVRTCVCSTECAKLPPMGLGHQLFPVDQDDRLHRLAVRKFEVMLRDPASRLFPQFSGQRVRAVNTFVELVNRTPTSLLRITCHVLPFDRTGCFDSAEFQQQEAGRYEEWVGSVLRGIRADHDESAVVDAANRFAARGGSWVPSASLARAIEDAALGRLKTARL
jgi:hypothetical protein